jgi:drug/metabolite transporter (DMT)-like permease
MTEKVDLDSKITRHYRAVGEAVFVTVLWASSWVIIKFGLEEIPPITFSGFRYIIAAVILLAIVLSKKEYRTSMQAKEKKWWGTLALYGIIFVSITQGAQFVGLDRLDAISVSILLNLTPIVVLFLGALMLREIPSLRQSVFIVLVVVGAMIYFYPLDLNTSEMVGLVVVIIGVIANALSSILGRAINSKRDSPPIVITAVSMTIGAAILVVVGLVAEGVVVLSPLSILYILWLSVVNTAFAFTLWNKAMQTLRAVDSAIINSTMLPQIVILSIVFLGEMPDLVDWFGLILLALSVAAVQVLQARKVANEESEA